MTRFLLLNVQIWRLRRTYSRTPAALAAIGVGATLVTALIVVIILLLTGGATYVSRNAALIGALIALGSVFTTQLVNTGLEGQRTREAALQRYFEQVGKLLADKDRPLHRSTLGDNLSTLVRAQTLAVLGGLDPTRKQILLEFLHESNLINAEQPIISLRGADLSVADLSEVDLTKTNLSEAELTVADLGGANLRGANLIEAGLEGVNLRGATLSQANLREANLLMANLKGATLIGTILGKANLGISKLNEANLSDATLIEADLGSATLNGANLSGANLRGVDLSGAKLNGANLSGANLSGANLGGTNLSGANLSGANLRETVNLIAAKKLTQDQINEATADEDTELPSHLQHPPHWSKDNSEEG